MEKCHIDITGPHPRTPRGSKYIVTFVDAFSVWAEAFTIPNKEAKTVARVLVQQVFCRFVTPVALLSDNTGELDVQLMLEICWLLDVDKQHTSFYYPETNAVADRFHGTLNSIMGRVVSEKDGIFAYRTFLLRIQRRHINRQSTLRTFSCLREK